MKTKKVAFLGMTITLAMILSYVESLVPPLTAFPGVKLGLPNLVMVLVLYKVGWRETVTVSLVRVLLVSLLFGNIQSMLFSISGALLSLLGMILLKKTGKFSCVAVSVVGGVLHNIGQIIFACFWTNTEQIAYLLPLYLFTGTVAGIFIGIASAFLVKGLEKFKI